MDILSQELVFAPVPDVAALGRSILYQYGQDAYAKGYELDFLISDEARKGWLAAEAEAEAAQRHLASVIGGW